MLPRESFSRHQQRVGPLIERFGESRLQLFEVSRPHGVKRATDQGRFLFSRAR
jgi:hypothetical protein